MCQAAAGLQMPSQTIYVRLRQAGIDAGPGPGITSADQAELVAARRRIVELETELAVTKRVVELVTEAVPPKQVRGYHADGR